MKIKSFRLSEETEAQILWLANRKQISATDVIREAVAEMFRREIEHLPKFILEDDIILVNGKPLIRCTPALIEAFPEDFLQNLKQGKANPLETILYLLLNATRLKESFELDNLVLAEEIGLSLPDNLSK